MGVCGELRHIAEERPVGLLGALLQVAHRPLAECRQHVDCLEGRAGRAFAQPLLGGRGLLHHMVALQPGEWRHIQRGGDAVELIEAERRRPAAERLRVVDIGRLLALGAGLALPAEAEMPLAEAGGVVALLAQHGGDGQAAGRNERARAAVEHAVLQPRAPGIAAGEQTVARRRADRRARMAVGAGQSLTCQPVHVRRGDLAVGVEALHVAIAQIIGQQVDDVRSTRRGLGAMVAQCGGASQCGTQQEATAVDVQHWRPPPQGWPRDDGVLPSAFSSRGCGRPR